MSESQPLTQLRQDVQDGLTVLHMGFDGVIEGDSLDSMLELSTALRDQLHAAGMGDLAALQHSLCTAFALRAEYGQPANEDERLIAATLFSSLAEAVQAPPAGADLHGVLAMLGGIPWLPMLDAERVHGLADRLAHELWRLSHTSRTAQPEPLDVLDPHTDAFDGREADAAFAIGEEAPQDAGSLTTEPALWAEDIGGGIDASQPPTDVGAFAFDEAGSDTVASDEDRRTLWISPEEQAMTREAIENQLLPLAQRLAEDEDPGQTAILRSDLAFQLSLVGNAMEMLGVPSIGTALNAVQRALDDDAPVDALSLLGWTAGALDLISRFDAESAGAFAQASHELVGLSDAWGALLLDETARVCVGLDPALLALRKTHAEPEDVLLFPADDVLPNVLQSMLRELPGNAERLGASVRAMVGGDVAQADEARRVAHTLKGDANTVGVRGLANLTHVLEDVMIEVLKQPEIIDDELGSFLQEAADTVEEIAEHLLGRGPAPSQLLDIYQQALDWGNKLQGMPLQGDASSTPPPVSHVAQVIAAPVPAQESATATASDAEEHLQARQISVDSRLLDELQRLAGEVLVMSRQVDQRLADLGNVYQELNLELRSEKNFIGQLDDLVALRGAALQSAAIQSGDVDPLEMDQYNELHVVSRHLLESQSDNVAHLQRIERFMAELEDLRSSQERLHDDLQRAVMRARRVPFRDITPRLQRIVRQTTRQLLKPVDLEVHGDDTLVDAELLERIVEPLSHLLRNAVDHGIEDAERRRSVGKPETGKVRLDVKPSGDAVEIAVDDDGRGLDLDAIRRKAERLGLIDADAVMDDEGLSRFILLPGFSTRDEVTQTSGRGVGMDVVYQRISALRGNLRVQTKPGEGSSMRISLPMSQSSANVVVASGHGVTMAAAANSIRRLHHVQPEQVGVDDDGNLTLRFDDQHYPALTIESLFDLPGAQSLPANGGKLAIITEDGFRREHAVLVREVGDIRGVVVKPISPLLPAIPAVRGMTQLGDGRLASVVDLGALIEARRGSGAWTADQLRAASQSLPRVVVADDSLSVRKALEQLMQDAGYDVAAARDGLEALKFIEERPPAAVLLDLEMPRMNGLEVCQHLRNQSQTRGVPVVMITSRASGKYQEMAAEAGVTRLIGKPFIEDELVQLVRELIAGSQGNERSVA